MFQVSYNWGKDWREITEEDLRKSPGIDLEPDKHISALKQGMVIDASFQWYRWIQDEIQKGEGNES